MCEQGDLLDLKKEEKGGIVTRNVLLIAAENGLEDSMMINAGQKNPMHFFPPQNQCD